MTSKRYTAKEVMTKWPELHAWFLAKKHPWATKMMDNLRQWNSMSQNQIDASLRIKADAEAAEQQKDLDRAVWFANSDNRRDGQAMPPDDPAALSQPAVDMAKIEQAFAHAMDRGIQRPKMVLDTLKFAKAPAGGSNPGAIYVNRKADGVYLGKIFAGVIKLSRDAQPEDADEIRRIAENPEEAARAYGLRTGVCCICSRPLTNGESIDLGIGPICREKFGW